MMNYETETTDVLSYNRVVEWCRFWQHSSQTGHDQLPETNGRDDGAGEIDLVGGPN